MFEGPAVGCEDCTGLKLLSGGTRRLLDLVWEETVVEDDIVA